MPTLLQLMRNHKHTCKLPQPMMHMIFYVHAPPSAAPIDRMWEYDVSLVCHFFLSKNIFLFKKVNKHFFFHKLTKLLTAPDIRVAFNCILAFKKRECYEGQWSNSGTSGTIASVTISRPDDIADVGLLSRITSRFLTWMDGENKNIL